MKFGVEEQAAKKSSLPEGLLAWGRFLERLNFWVNFFAGSLDHLNLRSRDQVREKRARRSSIASTDTAASTVTVPLRTPRRGHAFCRHGTLTRRDTDSRFPVIGYEGTNICVRSHTRTSTRGVPKRKQALLMLLMEVGPNYERFDDYEGPYTTITW